MYFQNSVTFVSKENVIMENLKDNVESWWLLNKEQMVPVKRGKILSDIQKKCKDNKVKDFNIVQNNESLEECTKVSVFHSYWRKYVK